MADFFGVLIIQEVFGLVCRELIRKLSKEYIKKPSCLWWLPRLCWDKLKSFYNFKKRYSIPNIGLIYLEERFGEIPLVTPGERAFSRNTWLFIMEYWKEDGGFCTRRQTSNGIMWSMSLSLHSASQYVYCNEWSIRVSRAFKCMDVAIEWFYLPWFYLLWSSSVSKMLSGFESIRNKKVSVFIIWYNNIIYYIRKEVFVDSIISKFR